MLSLAAAAMFFASCSRELSHATYSDSSSGISKPGAYNNGKDVTAATGNVAPAFQASAWGRGESPTMNTGYNPNSTNQSNSSFISNNGVPNTQEPVPGGTAMTETGNTNVDYLNTGITAEGAVSETGTATSPSATLALTNQSETTSAPVRTMPANAAPALPIAPPDVDNVNVKKGGLQDTTKVHKKHTKVTKSSSSGTYNNSNNSSHRSKSSYKSESKTTVHPDGSKKTVKTKKSVESENSTH